MKNLYAVLTILFCLTLGSFPIYGQGCVAIRGSSCSAGNSIFSQNVNLTKGQILAGTGFRYFKSFRHFRGTHEEKERVELGTEVINHSTFLDFFANYGITDRLYGYAIIPVLFHKRSSMYEHGGNPPNGLGERHETSSSGLSDIRLGLGYWLFDPMEHTKFNYAVSLGVKLPTGKYDYTDTFYNQGPERDEDREAVVDQSIQPGDGGTGLGIDIQGFHALSNSFFLNVNLYYLLNPEETNGVFTRNSTSREFSVPDQYAARLGAFYNTKLQGFSVYLGGRIEGIPSEDLIGGSAGYRRPGYAVSVEPGVNYANNRYNINFSVPVAVARNRTQSYEDKVRTIETGEYRHGDAAFADYLINFTISYRFGGHSMKHMEMNQDFNLDHN